MLAKLAARKVPVLFFILLASACRTAAQQPPGCAQDFFCLFNQEAAATGPGEIHRFSHDLVELIVPEEAGKDYINSLSDRLASAELAARNGRGKLIPEANVVRSFNELMRTIGAPPTFTADAASLRGFRARSATVLSLSALFTANRNGTNCDPGEAVLLLFLLIENDGGLSEHLFDEYEPPQAGGREKRSSVLVFGGGESLNMHAKGMLSEYSSKHRRHTTIKLLNRAAQTLGF